jgi:hypothetical protein
MTPREQKLIERLKERVKDPSRASDEGLAEVYPPVKARAVAAAERDLGFRLPELLRAIYTQVGNGGFGPAYGFLGLEGGATDEDGDTLVGVYRSLQELAEENSFWNWPDGLLPLCRLGCGMYACLDCDSARAPVVVFDPNPIWVDEEDEAEEGVDPEAVLLWVQGFGWQEDSFASWLQVWLDGRPEREPRSPSISWLRKRMWPHDPAYVRAFRQAVRELEG